MNVLVIAAHPDDETLGCGGVLLKHKAAGDSLYWLVATQAHEPQWSADTIELKAAEVTEVAQAYGMKHCFKLGFLAGCLDTLPVADLMQSIHQVIKEVLPETIYLINGGDVHTDHNSVFIAAMSVLKPFYMSSLGVKKVICYETLSSTEAGPYQTNGAFTPNIFSDITPYMDRKIAILEIYRTEAQPDPMPRGSSALRALARFRGATISVDYAESFMLVRELA
jgi:LmbE family N-acetylglucosaminyl deacetylase